MVCEHLDSEEAGHWGVCSVSGRPNQRGETTDGGGADRGLENSGLPAILFTSVAPGHSNTHARLTKKSREM